MLGLFIWLDLLALWLDWDSSILEPAVLAEIAFLSGADSRWVRALASMLTFWLGLMLLVVIVMFCWSARGLRLVRVVDIVLLRLVWYCSPGTCLDRLLSFSSWETMSFSSLRPWLKLRTLGYLARSWLTPSRIMMSSLSLL